MGTTIQSGVKSLKRENVAVLNNVSAYEKLMSKLQFSYYGIITMTLLISTMLGSIAVMYIFKANAPTWQLAVCTVVCLASNAAAIAHAPIKWVINFFATSVIINILLIAMNIF